MSDGPRDKSPVTEHRQSGRWLAKLAGDVGSECAAMFRKMDVPMYDALVNAMGQPYRGWDQQADGVLWYLLRLYCLGELVVLKVPAGGKPGRDVERERNQETLLRGLPDGLVACVDQDQHAAGFDGHLHLDHAWHFERVVVKNPFKSEVWFSMPVIGPLEAEGRVAPLEIGYTDPSRTFTHLRDHGLVARWPYGSEFLYVLALHQPEPDLRQLFKADSQLDQASRGGFVHTVCTALDLLRQDAQRKHGIARLPPDQGKERLKEIDVVTARAIQAAPRRGQGPMSVLVYSDKDAQPGNHPDDSEIEVKPSSHGWMMAAGLGVVAFAKEIDPFEDIPLP